MNNMKGGNLMKNMKVYLSLLLMFALCLSLFPLSAFAESGQGGDALTEETSGIIGDQNIGDYQRVTYPGELVVGHPTVMKGDFFTEMFGNDTADIDVRALIHGYNLVNWDQNQGTYVIDKSVVKDFLVMDNDVGDRTYYLMLWDDLCYSDGSPITAWDYAFSMLLMMSPEIEEIGGKIYRAEHILGSNAYLSGESKTLAGVEVLGEHQIAITLDHAFLPYFFEQGLLLCVPYPISVLAPGCKVYDDGEGVYIGNEDLSAAAPVYTAELLKKTILDPETGYNSHPSVVSGPYCLTEFDGVTAHFVKNPYFLGALTYNSNLSRTGGNATPVKRSDGSAMTLVKPTIEKICFTVANNDTLAQELKDGDLDLVNKVVYEDAIQEAKASGARFTRYPRIGLAFLTFTFEWPTVHEKEVRQAIAWCMDRDALTKAYCGDDGFRVDGYYGIEQWEYRLVTHQMDYPINLDKWDDLHFHGDYKDVEQQVWETLTLDNLTKYKVDLDKANALLDKAGWTLNRNGDAFRPGEDDVRCKLVDGELVALDLSMMYPAGNHIVDTLQENFIDNLNACGIQLRLVPADMQTLFSSYYRESERVTDMIYLATNFHVIVDPSITYSTDTTANHQIWNNTYSDDEELYFRAVNMRRTDPADVYDYVTKWVAFQERYNEVLPTIPIYSNYYYDFFTPRLHNYQITEHVTWTQAILQSTFTGTAHRNTDTEPPVNG